MSDDDNVAGCRGIIIAMGVLMAVVLVAIVVFTFIPREMM